VKTKKYSNKKIRIKFDRKKLKNDEIVRKKSILKVYQTKQIIIKRMSTKFKRLKNHRG
jgi:hypothetical protein